MARRKLAHNWNGIQPLVQAYGFTMREMNYYQVRLTHEEARWAFFDYYHTTGSLVMTRDGFSKKLGVVDDLEDVLICCRDYVYKNISQEA